MRFLFNVPLLLGGQIAALDLILALATTALAVAAAVLLFAADAREWFGEGEDVSDYDDTPEEER